MSIRRTTTVTTATPFAPSQRQSDSRLLTEIFKAYYNARSNKRNTHSQVRFERNLSFNLNTLYEAVRDRNYRPERSMCFIIRDPVQREVFAASFRDRIIHHYLYNQLEPVLDPAFIYDSYSCRKGKGTLFGIERLEHHIRSCGENYHRHCFALKLDIEGQLSDWRGLPESKSLFKSASGCGLPIGNLTSQLFSNVYLNELDQYVKRNLGFRHYGRYVDDFYIIDGSRDRLSAAVPLVADFLHRRLHLNLNYRKVKIIPVECGVPFLGAVVSPDGRHLSRRSTRRIEHRRMDSLCRERNPFALQAIVNSYSGYLEHFDTNFRDDSIWCA